MKIYFSGLVHLVSENETLLLNVVEESDGSKMVFKLNYYTKQIKNTGISINTSFLGGTSVPYELHQATDSSNIKKYLNSTVPYES